jgi:ATP-dependent Clp protease ATP-binding subunit ClpA
MFERFTDQAHRAVVLAQQEARMLNHNWIGTEHILLGLIREGDGVTAQVLVKQSADMNRTRQQVIQLLPRSQGQEVTGEGSQLGEQARARLLDDTLARVDALERRLAAIERWVGIRPDLNGLDQEIGQVRPEKEAAINRQDFDASAALRDKERRNCSPPELPTAAAVPRQNARLTERDTPCSCPCWPPPTWLRPGWPAQPTSPGATATGHPRPPAAKDGREPPEKGTAHHADHPY